MNPSSRILPALTLLLGFVFLISFRGLNEPDEGRYIEIAREMLVSGDYTVPRLKGIPHFAKPPMTYWAIAASMAVFGVNEFAARLPGFVAAMIVLLVLADLLRRMGGHRDDRWLLALLLVSTLEFFALTQIVTTDMLLCASVVTAMWARWNALHERAQQGRWNLVFWLIIALGFLIKGPIIVMVVFLGLIAGALWERSLRLLTNLGLLWGLPLALAVVAPWFWFVVEAQPGLKDFFFGDEVVGRFKSGRGRAKPFYYFLVVFPLVLLPWTWHLARWGRRVFAHNRSAAVFLGGWIAGPFLCFSLASSKLWTYMLPLVPPAVLLLLLGIRTSEEPKRRGLAVTAFCMLGLLCAAVIAGNIYPLRLGNNNSYAAFLKALPARNWCGQEVRLDSSEPSSKVAFVEGSGPRIATYRFRCLQASFYLFRKRPQFVPVYGNKSLWEWEDMQDADQPGTLGDLVTELRSPHEFVVLTKSRFVAEIEGLLGRPLRVLADSGEGRRRVVALTNK